MIKNIVKSIYTIEFFKVAEFKQTFSLLRTVKKKFIRISSDDLERFYNAKTMRISNVLNLSSY